MIINQTRLGAWALIIGTVVAAGGYLAADTFVPGTGDARYISGLWAPLNAIAIAGDIIIALGLPVILIAHGRRSPRLTLIGYIGLFATLIMLNIGEGCLEAFVKPYLASHGGIPAHDPTALSVFEDVALLCLVAGLLCLGVAVIRARVFPRWAGVLLIASAPAGFLGLPGPLALLSDYLAFAALFTTGLQMARAESRHPADIRTPSEAPAPVTT
jgi:hypothetical protein